MAGSDKTDNKERSRIGRLCGVLGIILNLVLSGSKLICGYAAGSMSIVADGVNNLSDAGSSIVTLLGFHMADKPPDAEHPYGHARYEYLASLTVSVMILVVGVELAKSSVTKLMKPSDIDYSSVLIIVLLISICIKCIMMIYNTVCGRRIQSEVLIAAAADSRNDMITTAAVLAANLTEHFAGVRLDGVMGLAVAVFIIYSGYDLAAGAVSTLLGRGASADLRAKIVGYIESQPMVLGCHDLMVHDYGPGRIYASLHVEMDRNIDTMLCHELIDGMEDACLEQFDTHMVIHYDPVITDDEEINRVRCMVTDTLQGLDDRLSMHDFRMLRCEGHVRLKFDLEIPEDMLGREEEIRSCVEASLNEAEESQYRVAITFDIKEI